MRVGPSVFHTRKVSFSPPAQRGCYFSDTFSQKPCSLEVCSAVRHVRLPSPCVASSAKKEHIHTPAYRCARQE